MASINLTKLKPGKTYVVKARAIDADGNYSQYSFGYLFTVPSAKADGTQLTATNNSVVTALASSSSTTTGGALIAGGLDANGAAAAGALDLGNVWNGTASSISQLTGTASTGAVVINSTGILGYQLLTSSSGQANFFLDTYSGNAYFRGTVYAASGQIGGFNIGSTSLYNTSSGNTISMNSGAYPNFTIAGASSSLIMSGDSTDPYIKFDNSVSQNYSDMILRYGSIGSPDFGSTSTNSSRGEILFWSPTSTNPNQITIRRFGEAFGGPDGQAFIDLSTNAIAGTPDEVKIGIQASQSVSTGTGNDINPNDNERVFIDLYKAFGDTSASSYPARLRLAVNESGYSNSQTMYKDSTSFTATSPDSFNTMSLSASSTYFYGSTNVYDVYRANNYSFTVGGYGSSATMLLYNRPGLSAPLLKIIADDASTSNFLELFFGNTRKSYFDSNGQFIGLSSSALYAPDVAASISNTQIANTAFVSNASLNAYNSASTYTQSSAWNNTSASIRYAASAGYLPVSGLSESTITIGSTAVSLGDSIDNLVGLSGISLMGTAEIELEYNPPGPGLKIKNHYLNVSSNLLELTTYSSPSNPLVYFDNGGNLVSSRTASFSNKVTAASFVGNGSEITLITASNVFGTVGSAASVGSTVIGGILNSSSNAFTLLATPLTINAFGGASAITIGYQANGTSIVNIGNQGNTGTRTLNLFTTLGGSGGQNTINIGASGTTTVSIPQVINIGKATGAFNTITIGGSTSTALTLDATASVTGKITAASVIATQVTGGGMDLVYSGSFASTSGSVLIDNIFSSNYANYRVTYTTASNASNTSIYFRYANVGVPSSSALYTYATLSNATSTTTSNSSSVIYHSVGAYATGATHVFEFYGPALTTTHMYKSEIYDSYIGGPTQQTVRGSYTNSSSFSGIVLGTAVTSANFNGTVRVYGYHN